MSIRDTKITTKTKTIILHREVLQASFNLVQNLMYRLLQPQFALAFRTPVSLVEEPQYTLLSVYLKGTYSHRNQFLLELFSHELIVFNHEIRENMSP